MDATINFFLITHAISWKFFSLGYSTSFICPFVRTLDGEVSHFHSGVSLPLNQPGWNAVLWTTTAVASQNLQVRSSDRGGRNDLFLLHDVWGFLLKRFELPRAGITWKLFTYMPGIWAGATQRIGSVGHLYMASLRGLGFLTVTTSQQSSRMVTRAPRASILLQGRSYIAFYKGPALEVTWCHSQVFYPPKESRAPPDVEERVIDCHLSWKECRRICIPVLKLL